MNLGLFTNALQVRLLTAVEKFAGLPGTNVPSGNSSPVRWYERLVAALEVLPKRVAGYATLASGTVDVANTNITASSLVLTQRITAGGTVAVEYEVVRNAGVGFTINAKTGGSVVATDTSVIGYYVVEMAPTVATPTVNVAAGTYNNTQTVTISSATSGVSFRYTLDGSTPTRTSGYVYGIPLTISTSQTLKVMAWKEGALDSAVLSQAYVITCATPTASPAAGTYTGSQSVVLASATTGAAIYYTVDGSTPDATKTLYSGAVTVAASKTVKAIAIKTGFNNSGVLSAAYVIN